MNMSIDETPLWKQDQLANSATEIMTRGFTAFRPSIDELCCLFNCTQIYDTINSIMNIYRRTPDSNVYTEPIGYWANINKAANLMRSSLEHADSPDCSKSKLVRTECNNFVNITLLQLERSYFDLEFVNRVHFAMNIYTDRVTSPAIWQMKFH